MGLKVNQDSFRKTNFQECRECGSVCEIKVNVNLMVKLKEMLDNDKK